jgi:tetratricopeptide (TPR) repeat protein
MVDVGERREGGAAREGRLDPDELAALEEQHSFLIRSLVDLDREYEAGDLDDADYATLKDDYRARAEAVQKAIAARKARFAAAKRKRSPLAVASIVAGTLAFAVLAGVVVAQAVGRRQPGQEISGDVRASTRDKLAQCFQQGASQQLLDATKCYGDVLKVDPANAEGRAYLGWFLYLSRNPQLQGDAQTQIERVLTESPSYPDAHAFEAVILRDQGKTAEALAQLDQLDALHPSSLIQSLVGPLRTELQASTTTTTSP